MDRRGVLQRAGIVVGSHDHPTLHGVPDLVFQAITWWNGDVEDEDEDDDDEEEQGGNHTNKLPAMTFLMKAFGLTRTGESVAVTVKGFSPFFYVKVPGEWPSSKRTAFLHKLRDQREAQRVDLVRKCDFLGFRNGETDEFACITCACHRDVKFMQARMTKDHRKTFKDFQPIAVYEGNISPLLRFFHMRDLQPAGWVRVSGFSRMSSAPASVEAKTDVDVEVDWRQVHRADVDDVAPILVASFDIECNSANGDFPLAKAEDKYDKLASCVIHAFEACTFPTDYDAATAVECMLCRAFGLECSVAQASTSAMHAASMIFPVLSATPASNTTPATSTASTTHPTTTSTPQEQVLSIKRITDDVKHVLGDKNLTFESKVAKISRMLQNSMRHMKLEGDEVIQIGTTFHVYGQQDCCYKHVITLGSCDEIPGVDVEPCDDEGSLLLRWADLIRRTDPDVVTGFNIFGFDMAYLYDRAGQLFGSPQSKDMRTFLSSLSRFRAPDTAGMWQEQKLSSSALGENLLRYIDMHGRVSIDLMKVVQRDHRLDSYKLDSVAEHFIGMKKNDVSPKDIFRLQRGGAGDRRVIAEYCVQDCALCNRLIVKLDTLANNMGMANVCSVPLSFIFMRGQGVKVFSLVAKQCRLDGFLVPLLSRPDAAAEEQGYEGAIVLEPEEGIYLDTPVSVLDYASLYPSSMISENLSHDCIVLEDKYDNLPGVEYVDIEPVAGRVCRFAQSPQGVLPRILNDLLKQRKATRKRMTLKRLVLESGESYQGYEGEDGQFASEDGKFRASLAECRVRTLEPLFNSFQQGVLDGLQLAYKVTANSLYGQVGASTSPIFYKDIAACTTATGRKMIMKAKAFLEEEYGGRVVYGDTDSIFVTFDNRGPDGAALFGKDALQASIDTASDASVQFKKHIKRPHQLEYEKTFWPFILFAKKRYVGNLYETDTSKYKQKSMGIVLKRRDNAPIVKKIFGGALDIVLNRQDIPSAIAFLRRSLDDIAAGRVDLQDLVITKSLRASYKDPERIAHHVLAQRMGQRDPGNKPQVNDRIPFVYVEHFASDATKKVLQGDRIEHPDYVREKKVRPDYRFYITNQIMKPSLQLFSIVLEKIDGFDKPNSYYPQLYKAQLEGNGGDVRKAKDKIASLKEAHAKAILFDPVIERIDKQLANDGTLAKKQGMRAITSFFAPRKQ